uniref:Uncharacterized protein n=1 Tax=Gallus gallus TaxID=9031 RepID=A0A8V1AA82_CHICK
AVAAAGVRFQLVAARHQPHLRVRSGAAPGAVGRVLPGRAGAAAAGVRRARRLFPHLPARHQTGRGGRAQPHLPGHHHLQPQRVPLLQDHPQRHVPRGRAAGAAQRALRDQQPAAGRARRAGGAARQGQLQELQGQTLQHGRVLQPHRPRPGRHAAAVLLPRRRLLRTQLQRDLHPPGQVLHLQLGAAGHGAADHAAGRRGERAGADAQHPAGGVPPRLGGHGRDVVRGGGEGADPQPAGAALHRPAGLRRGARLPDLRVVPAAAASPPAAWTARRATWPRTATAAWCTCPATPTSARRSSTRSARTPRWVRTGPDRCGGGGKGGGGGGTDPTPPSPGADFLVKKDSEYCACRTPCDTVRYGKELSMVKIPSKASARYLARKFNKTEQYIADNVLVLDIFFEALNYEMIEQKKAYEVAGLLGDIGGQMGLFIGASLLTILEIFDYLYEVFRDKLIGFYKDKKRMRRGSSTTLEHPAVPGSPAATLPPRTPIGPCAATRTVSPSPRTCYLVTRL